MFTNHVTRIANTRSRSLNGRLTTTPVNETLAVPISSQPPQERNGEFYFEQEFDLNLISMVSGS